MIHRPEPSACTLGALEEKRQRTRRGLQGCPDDPTPVRVTGLACLADGHAGRGLAGGRVERKNGIGVNSGPVPFYPRMSEP